MGRGGGRSGGGHSGGRSGGFSRGGSRGFSSRRSAGQGRSRGGGARSSARRSSSGFYSNRRRPGGSSPRPLFGGIFISGFGGGGGFSNKTQMPLSSSDSSPGSGSFNPPPDRDRGPDSQGMCRETRRGNGGIPGWYMVLMAIMVIFSAMLFWNAAQARSDAAGHPVREKLAESACITEDVWIDDSLDWLGNDTSVREAMKYFQDKTGIQPYLLITDNLDGKGGEITDKEAETYLAGLYDSLYSDEGHMIFTFMEYAPSQYITYLYTGTAADSVMDADARNLFLDCADRYYADSSLSDAEFFEKVFVKAAELTSRDTDRGAFDAFARMKEKADRELARAQASEALSAGSEEAEDLMKKYGGASPSDADLALEKLKAELGL